MSLNHWHIIRKRKHFFSIILNKNIEISRIWTKDISSSIMTAISGLLIDWYYFYVIWKIFYFSGANQFFLNIPVNKRAVCQQRHFIFLIMNTTNSTELPLVEKFTFKWQRKSTWQKMSPIIKKIMKKISQNLFIFTSVWEFFFYFKKLAHVGKLVTK